MNLKQAISLLISFSLIVVSIPPPILGDGFLAAPGSNDLHIFHGLTSPAKTAGSITKYDYDTRRWAAILLVAGKGERLEKTYHMRKPLIPVAGVPMFMHFLNIAQKLKLRTIVSTPEDDEEIEIKATGFASNTVPAKLGTMNAVAAPRRNLKRFKGDILIVPVDCVMRDPETLISLMDQRGASKKLRPPAGSVTSVLSEPHGLDRIIRGKNDRIIAIITQNEINELREKGKTIKLKNGKTYTAEMLEAEKEAFVGLWILNSSLYKFVCRILKPFTGKKSISSFDKADEEELINTGKFKRWLLLLINTGKLKRWFLLSMYRLRLFGFYRSDVKDNLFDLNTQKQIEFANTSLPKPEIQEQLDDGERKHGNLIQFRTYVSELKELGRFSLIEFFKRLTVDQQQEILDTFKKFEGHAKNKPVQYTYAETYLKETHKANIWTSYLRSSYKKDIDGLKTYCKDKNWDVLIERFQEWFAAQPFVRFMEIAGIEKVGQALSVRPEFLSEGFREAFEKFQDRGVPTPMYEIIRVIEGDYGAHMHDIFDKLDDHEPERPYLKRLNVGTVADTFMGKFKDGGLEVFKIVTPSKRSRVLNGLTIISEVADELEANKHLFKGDQTLRISPRRFFKEFKKAVKRELHMLVETSQAQALIRHYPIGFSKPNINHRSCTENVFVISFIPGIRVTELTNRKLRRWLGIKILVAIALQALADGIFHSDPHPGNVFYDEGFNLLGLFDFGQVGRLDRKLRKDLLKFMVSIMCFEEKKAHWRIIYRSFGFLLQSRLVAKFVRIVVFRVMWLIEKPSVKQFGRLLYGLYRWIGYGVPLKDTIGKPSFKQFGRRLYGMYLWIRYWLPVWYTLPAVAQKIEKAEQKSQRDRDIAFSHVVDFDQPLKKLIASVVEAALEEQTDEDAEQQVSDMFKGMGAFEMDDGLIEDDEQTEPDDDDDKASVDKIVVFLEEHGIKTDTYNKQQLTGKIEEIVEEMVEAEKHPEYKWGVDEEGREKQPYIAVDKAVYAAEAAGLNIETPYDGIMNLIFTFINQQVEKEMQISADEPGLKAEIASILRFQREGDTLPMIPKAYHILMATERFGYPIVSPAGMFLKALFIADGVRKILNTDVFGFSTEAEPEIQKDAADALHTAS